MHYKEPPGYYNYYINMHTFCLIDITAALNNFLLKFNENSSKYLNNS